MVDDFKLQIIQNDIKLSQKYDIIYFFIENIIQNQQYIKDTTNKISTLSEDEDKIRFDLYQNLSYIKFEIDDLFKNLFSIAPNIEPGILNTFLVNEKYESEDIKIFILDNCF